MRKPWLLTFALFLAFAFAPRSLPAAQIAGVTMDQTMALGGKTLSLAGVGIRTKTFLRIKVYAAGLYMEEPVLEPGRIIASDQAWAMLMIFLYKEVEGEKLQEAWREGFGANTPSAGPDLEDRMEDFVSLFPGPALKGDRYLFTYEPGKGTTVALKGRTVAVIQGADFARSLMAVWFGDNLADGGLRALKKSILEGLE